MRTDKYEKIPGKKRIVFLTGTRADFGKIKSLIKLLVDSGSFDVHIFATGMHMLSKYGYTVNEIEKEKFSNIYRFINQSENTSLDAILANTIQGFGQYVKEFNPDVVVIHGDRIEALAGALVGSLNNIMVVHIEGGEVSGTIDEHIRHAISKVSHIHFVSNTDAQKRLVQMGEKPEDVFVVGSPDIDIMSSPNLPSLQSVKKRYGLRFERYALLVHHPVTTETHLLQNHMQVLIKAVKNTPMNYIIIHPNNDPGTDIIQETYKREVVNDPRFKVFPSIRFEYFLTLLKNCNFVIGNSSLGVREAPYYGIPSINIGTRQLHRTGPVDSIFNCDYDADELIRLMQKFSKTRHRFAASKKFGDGKSGQKIFNVLKQKQFWNKSIQKQFQDINF